MSQLDIVGTLYNHAAAPHPDERIALAESEGPFILADAKDAPRWLGLDYGGRWKTWVLGPLASLPMIPWPKFDRFHRHKHEAEGAYVALRGAIETCMVGAPIIEKPGAGESPEARYAGVYPQESDGEANPIGFLMMDECNDYDFAVHMTKGMACLRGGNYDGPRMVSYRPPPAACTVATKKGINDRIDHIVLVFHPGPDDQREFIRDGLRGAGPDGNHVDVKIDCMSGVIVAFWSRLSGRDMLGHYDDPAMGLCNDGLVKAGGAMAIPERLEGFEARKAGPGAWAFIVNPGKWTSRWWYTDTSDGAGLSACIFSRDGAEPFNPDLDCSMPGILKPEDMPPDPMQAAQSRMKEIATDKATQMVQDQFDDMFGQYMPAAVMERWKRWAQEKLYALVAGCVSTVLIGLLILGILGLVVVVSVVKMMMG